MKGQFKTSIMKYCFCLFFFVGGAFIAIRFGLWGIDAVREGKTAVAVFCFTFLFIGLLSGVVSIFLFNYNRNAYIEIDEEKVNARFGFGTELHESASNIKKAELSKDAKSISLFVADRICFISGLRNAKELCNYIAALNVGSRYLMTADEAVSNLAKCRKVFLRYLILTVAFTALLFANIAWCVSLTDGKDLGAFSQKDDLVFVGFAIAELITLIVLFFFADRCGKQHRICELSKRTLHSVTAAEHKCDSLENYPSVIEKKYFDDYTYRIVVFSPENDVYAYMLEYFDFDSKSWISRYSAATTFNSLSELLEDIDESFENVILED